MARILLITGLWVPVIGRAPRDGKKLAERLARTYPRANLTWHSWWDTIESQKLRDASPLILIGHSFGGAACLRLAKDLEKIGKSVDELLLLDPVPTDFKSRWRRMKLDVPPNVKLTRCIARTVRIYPRSKKARGTQVSNETRWIGHDKFMSNRDIVEIIERIVRRFE